MVSDCEYTDTRWSEKRGIEGLAGWADAEARFTDDTESYSSPQFKEVQDEPA
jgi:hypothetical protein